MQIENNKVVSFHYQLKEVDGDYTEDSRGGNPMLYLHGHRGILPGLEDAMAGRDVGESFSIVLSPEKAYGPRNEKGIQRVPKKHLVDVKVPVVGKIVSVNTPKGAVRATIVKLGRHSVDIDTNHPLAGKSLEFEVEVIEVREASMEEVTHRHAHGPGGHSH